MIGHCMGASSAIETILTFKSMEEQILLPTINYQPDPAIGLDIASETAIPLSQEYVLKNAFGFGGCNTCAVFHRSSD